MILGQVQGTFQVSCKNNFITSPTELNIFEHTRLKNQINQFLMWVMCIKPWQICYRRSGLNASLTNEANSHSASQLMPKIMPKSWSFQLLWFCELQLKGKFPLQLCKLPKYCLICCCFSEYSLHSPHDSRLADHARAVYLSGTKSHSFVINQVVKWFKSGFRQKNNLFIDWNETEEERKIIIH